MPDPNNIPHLIDLLDDRSLDVREHVLRELLAFGPSLHGELRNYMDKLTPEKLRRAQAMIARHREAESRMEAWAAWPSLSDRHQQLETAFELLAQFQYGWKPPVTVRELLDDLARNFLATCHTRDPLSLSRFLFVTKKLRGNVDDYYAPLNNNLVHVIQQRSGLPISLVSIFILVGHRCGISIEGCCAPQHFLARATMNGASLVFDCFNGGHILTEKEIAEIRSRMAPRLWYVLEKPARSVDIVRRVLNNLIYAYELQGDVKNRDLMRELQEYLPPLD